MTPIIGRIAIAALMIAGTGLARAAFNENDLLALAQQVAEAHGGIQRWSRLGTFSVEREHHMFRDDSPFRFRIIGEYATRRIYQAWTQPGGEVVWDGERAWSNDWGFDDRFSARFTTSIGFHLANLPWLLLDPGTRLLSQRREAGVLPGSDDEFVVLEIELEADPVRKPRGFDGPRDRFGVIVDPKSYRVAGVIERRTYAGQLDLSGAKPEQTRFEDVFVIESHLNAGGLLWPERYSLYTLRGDRYGAGRFFDYAFDVAFREEWMRPRTGGTSRFDLTSSYRRAPVESADPVPERSMD